MPTKVPAVIGPVGTRSAPCTSLLSTLPVRVSWFSVAVTALVSPAAVGTSSTIFTSIEPLAVLPSVSVALTVKLSPKLLVPLALGCASLSSKV
ncbi:hypothetical protein D3C77_552020 [compost metagenome]